LLFDRFRGFSCASQNADFTVEKTGRAGHLVPLQGVEKLHQVVAFAHQFCDIL
jgi:hypothetical protein